MSEGCRILLAGPGEPTRLWEGPWSRGLRCRRGARSSVWPVGAGLLAISAILCAVYQLEGPGAGSPAASRDSMSLVGLRHRDPRNGDEEQPQGSEDCQDAKAGTQCYEDIVSAAKHIAKHPEWYVGLHEDSSIRRFQAFLHNQRTRGGLPRCPKPCGHVEAFDEPVSGCHDAAKGETCYNHVLFTMNENLPTHPDWYPGLQTGADFKTVQAYLHGQRVCPEPCGLAEKPAQRRGCRRLRGRARDDCEEQAHCHTAIHGEPCYGTVLWIMDHVVKRPGWYPGLTGESSFEEVQAYIHRLKNSTSAQACPLPCNKPVVQAVKKLDMEHRCHTAKPGETCYTSVVWVIEQGLVKHPEWYKTITKNSTFEEVQARVHEDAKTPCKMLPCPCHTAEKGEKCWDHIQWVYKTGLVNHSEWFAELHNDSTLEEVQTHLHGEKHPTCPMPCQQAPWKKRSKVPTSADCRTAKKGEKCWKHIEWVYKVGLVRYPKWYPELSNSSTVEEVQANVHRHEASTCPMPCQRIPAAM